MEVPSSPREDSVAVVIPTAIPTPAPGGHPSRKRKHAAMSHVAASSPAPSDPGATPGPENLVVPTRHRDLAARPRLTISRHPLFVPVSPGSLYYTTEPLCNNRLNFRYIPAGIAPPESILPFRTIESAPTTFRVSWEDRSPFVKVTQDGLGLKGEKGFRSARCNAPVREGKWYMEIKVELGGEKAPDSKRRESSHVRLGWARREAPLNGPAGLDGYSYALRDKTGEKIHLSRLRPYGRPFVSGDVVGMYISLPSPRRKPDKKDPCDPAHIKREYIAIDFKGQEYYESLEYTQSKEMIALMDASDRAKATNSSSLPSSSTKKSATVKNLPSTSRGAKRGERETAPMRPLPTLGADSRIAFFVNGECQGIAFQDLYDYLPLRVTPDKSQKKKTNKEGLREHRENPFDDGTLGYYPFISLFNEARVRLNPGPDFDFPPPPDIDAVLSNSSAMDIRPPASKRTWRPMCERYPEFIAEQKAMDELEEAEARKVQKVVDPDQEKAEADKVEQHRAKRRAQAAARRERKIAQKAKEEEEAREKRRKLDEEQIALGKEEEVPMQVDDDRFGPPISMSVPDTPTLTDLAVMDGDTDRAPSPAPSASTVDATMPGFHDTSGYNTEIEDGDGEVVLEMDNTEGETGIVRTLAADPEAFDTVPVTDSLPCAAE